ncbi:NAD(P)-dependent oxidoreductase [Rhizobium sp. ZPR3]|uniref:NAD(P)-dependent oxidoreductase n=2 Tax=unclassified Rhizobium TaxID=2613769 RepID=A0AAU7SA06_9HYPH
MSCSAANGLNIGIVGAGKMGAPIAQRLADGGYNVTICDRDPTATESLKKAGFRALSSARDLAARCEIILGCVSGPGSYWSVTGGPDGILHGDRVHTYINVGTTGPELAAKIEETLAEREIQTLDAPVTGGPRRAHRGELAAMVSGPSALAESLRPILKSYASKIVYVGDAVGQAQYLKVANNLITAGNLVIALEALTLASKVGISPGVFLEVINAGSAASDVTLVKLPNHVLTRTFDFGASLALVDHDVSACLAAAESAGVEMAVGHAIQAIYREAIASSGPLADLTIVAKFLEERVGAGLCNEESPGGWDVVP